ncbi:arsenate reductase [Bradyrhizobium sp. S3.3.6]|uniref:arsenate reductase ArsC n=1 Tax=Bradyrhizobium sp. S3.3.6 TaxID=3156429 RepID=UPI0033939700
MDRPYGMLFISRRNSARSLMAEAVVNRLGGGHFRAYSAAVEPSKVADPLALEVLQEAGFQTDGLRPKHWRNFTGPEAPVLDFVFTLSNTASREAFPDWPGKPVSSHWHYPDPVAVKGDEWQKRHGHSETLSALERQMRAFMLLSLASLDRIALKKRLDELGTLDVVSPSELHPNQQAIHGKIR